jgi:hypothetical protein
MTRRAPHAARRTRRGLQDAVLVVAAGVPPHAEYAEHFSGVKRIRLAQVPGALKYMLWDMAAQRLISVAEYQAARAALPNRGQVNAA